MLNAPLARARDVTRNTAELIRPPRRITPAESAEQNLRSEKGSWDSSLVPMLIEPLNALGGREYQGVVFVGPVRTGKTMGLILGGVAHIVTSAPGDSLIVQMSQESARDFSRTDLDRVIRHSPEIASRLSPRAKDDNTYDKFFRSGMMLKLGWPAVSQLSSKTLQYVLITDYDRPENRDNVDGEGPVWDLAIKRVATYMSRGKCLAESSPGEDYVDAKWVPNGAHEAPPARGILSLYNRGTRARWYWPCQGCGEPFEAAPGLKCFAMPDLADLEKMVLTRDLMGLAEELARVVCPHCGTLHEQSHRRAMNAGGLWVHQGQAIATGAVVGDRRRTQIASYWLGGVAAVYQSWVGIMISYLQAMLTYVRTGDEHPLKATTNTDQGAAYLPMAALKRRGTDDLMQRLEAWEQGYVPDGVRFLTAAVDVQGARFVVHVMGWGVGLESWLIDRFSITAGERLEGDSNAGVDPGAYVEDWSVLVERVLKRRYRCNTGDLGIMVVMCDSGGAEGVTDKAYEFWRRMAKRGLGKRFRLVKGTHMNAPRIQKSWPDSRSRKDRSLSKGDVPVWLLNVNALKDGIAGDLGRDEPGPGYVHIPNWVDAEYFSEMTAETRTDKGWKNELNARNEAFDLHVYNRAACIVLRAEAINWQQPPTWAAERVVVVEPKPIKTHTRPKGNWVTNW